MIEKLELEIPLLLPENGDCGACVHRLQEALSVLKGIAGAHMDRSGAPQRLCLHFDPNLISPAEVERRASREGVTIQQRYRHSALRIAGMDCAECAGNLEKGVGRQEGVLQCTVDFTAARMAVEYDAEVIDRRGVVGRILRLGYDVVEEGPAGTAAQGAGPGGLRGLLVFMGGKRRDTLTLTSGLLILLAFGLGAAGAFAGAVQLLFALAIATGGFFIARKGLAGAWINRELDINFLMTVAAVGAAAIGAWAEGALVVFLFRLGETLESYTLAKARNAIRSLMELAPAEATVLSLILDCEEHLGQPLSDGGVYDGGPCLWCEVDERVLPVAELVVSDVILVRPGERVPMDGRVVRGNSAVNQAPITGESVPVEKGPGDDAFAGSVNGEGALEIEVTRLAADNTLSRIIHMVEEAQAQQAPSQRWVDRFARYYTPTVVGLAIATAVVPPMLFGQPFLEPVTGTAAGLIGAGHGWLYRALALLIIACPCALVISTPVSIVSAISNAAGNGVLVKGGACLEAAGRLRVMAFDKTGTLTRGEPVVTDVIPLDERSEEEVLALAAAVESRSEHPLARAIVSRAEQRNIPFTPAAGFQALAGRGARALLDGSPVHIGNRSLLAEIGAPLPERLNTHLERLEAEGKTVMFVAVADRPPSTVGLIAVADTVRPDAREAVAALKRSGISRTVMLTGDNERTSEAIAAQVGVDEVQAGLLPAEKVDAVKKLQEEYGQVAMVGDGVNDAPALARATVGIAMGGAGTDQALETADIALMADDLRKLPFAIHLSRRTWGIVRQNVAFSLFVKVGFMALALAGLATLWMAVFADVGASLIVILNGMRLSRNDSSFGSPNRSVSRQLTGRKWQNGDFLIDRGL